jgi:hypothetical protein
LIGLKNFLIVIIAIMVFVPSLVSFDQLVQALNIVISHGGAGDLELCFESDGYENQCDDIILSEYQNPFQYILEVEDPDQGHNFQVCYEIRDTDVEDCRNFEFTGSSQQTVNVEIPSTELPTGGGTASNNEDFSLQNTEGDSPSSSPDTPEESPGLPPLPPSLP